MWFDTNEGVVKFDGSNFTLFNNANGLSGVVVLDLFEDEQQRLWVKTYSQKPSYIYKNKVFNGANTSHLDQVTTTRNSICYHQGANSMWILSGDTTYQYNDTLVTRYPHTNLTVRDRANMIFLDIKDGKPTYVNSKGLLSWNNNSLTYRQHWPGGPVISKRQYGNGLLVVRESGIYQVNGQQEVETFRLPENLPGVIRSLWIDSQQGLWLLLSNNGIYRLKAKPGDSYKRSLYVPLFRG